MWRPTSWVSTATRTGRASGASLFRITHSLHLWSASCLLFRSGSDTVLLFLLHWRTVGCLRLGVVLAVGGHPEDGRQELCPNTRLHSPYVKDNLASEVVLADSQTLDARSNTNERRYPLSSLVLLPCVFFLVSFDGSLTSSLCPVFPCILPIL